MQTVMCSVMLQYAKTYLYLVLSIPCRLWYCLSHSFPISELNKIYIIHVSLMRPIGLPNIQIFKFAFTKNLDFLRVITILAYTGKA